MKRVFSFLTVVALVAGALVFNQGCGKASADATKVTQSYGGPGSEFKATLNPDGTCQVTHAPSVGAAVDLTVVCTFVRLATGYVKLTVVSSSGTATDKPAAGVQAYGLEIPGFAFLMKPIGSGDSHIIPMVVSGSCPTANFSANWVLGEKRDDDDALQTTNDYFGTFSYNATTGAGTIPTKYALAGPFTSLTGGAGVTGLSACANGQMNFTGGSMWLTQQGGALVHSTNGVENEDQIIIAMPQSTLTTAALAGNYGGLGFDKNGGSGQKVFPITGVATATDANTLTIVGTKVSDIETGAVTSDQATVTLTALNSPSAGFMTGVVTQGALTGKMACMGAANVVSSGKNMMFCIGQSPNQNSKIFNILLVSK